MRKRIGLSPAERAALNSFEGLQEKGELSSTSNANMAYANGEILATYAGYVNENGDPLIVMDDPDVVSPDEDPDEVLNQLLKDAQAETTKRDGFVVPPELITEEPAEKQLDVDALLKLREEPKETVVSDELNTQEMDELRAIIEHNRRVAAEAEAALARKAEGLRATAERVPVPTGRGEEQPEAEEQPEKEQPKTRDQLLREHSQQVLLRYGIKPEDYERLKKAYIDVYVTVMSEDRVFLYTYLRAGQLESINRNIESLVAGGHKDMKALEHNRRQQILAQCILVPKLDAAFWANAPAGLAPSMEQAIMGVSMFRDMSQIAESTIKL